jgi:hypothetical protein
VTSSAGPSLDRYVAALDNVGRGVTDASGADMPAQLCALMDRLSTSADGGQVMSRLDLVRSLIVRNLTVNSVDLTGVCSGHVLGLGRPGTLAFGERSLCCHPTVSCSQHTAARGDLLSDSASRRQWRSTDDAGDSSRQTHGIHKIISQRDTGL